MHSVRALELADDHFGWVCVKHVVGMRFLILLIWKAVAVGRLLLLAACSSSDSGQVSEMQGDS